MNPLLWGHWQRGQHLAVSELSRPGESGGAKESVSLSSPLPSPAAPAFYKRCLKHRPESKIHQTVPGEGFFWWGRHRGLGTPPHRPAAWAAAWAGGLPAVITPFRFLYWLISAFVNTFLEDKERIRRPHPVFSCFRPLCSRKRLFQPRSPTVLTSQGALFVHIL